MHNACINPFRLILWNAQVLRYPVGNIKADPRDITGYAVRIISDDINGIFSIFFEYFCAVWSCDPVFLKKPHNLSYCMMLSPKIAYLRGLYLTYSFNLGKLFRILFNYLKGSIFITANQCGNNFWAYSLNKTEFKILSYPVDGCRKDNFKGLDL